MVFPYAPLAAATAAAAAVAVAKLLAIVLFSTACVCCACACTSTVCCGRVAANAACAVCVCNPCKALAKGTCLYFQMKSFSCTNSTNLLLKIGRKWEILTVIVPWLFCTALANGTVIVPWLPSTGLTICGGCNGVVVVGNTRPGVGSSGTFLCKFKKLLATTLLLAMVGVANGKPVEMLASVGAAADKPSTALLATASIAWILAVAAAAATAAAVGMDELTVGPIRAFGGVIARPTRSNCPPKSNKFMLWIASSIACLVEYSMNP